ncbi:anti-sigma factor [Gordonia malaquae]|uniref:anti-sigma factor n=1 Tax=Gordonia malaquae TaxID=410332 RepID=UPI0030FE7B69
MTDMSESNEHDDLLDMAVPYALDALDELGRARVQARVAAADASVRDAFRAEVASVRDVLADLSEATAQSPRAGLRDEVLDRAAQESGRGRRLDSRRPRWIAAAAAAAVVVAIGGGIIGYAASRQEPPSQTTAERVFGADDVRTTTGALASGRASVTYSESAGAGVLVMNDVPPPAAGTVYQLWLVGPNGARLGGVMTPDDVAPSTTATVDDLGDATSIAFTVGDAARPETMISDPVASLPLG